MGIIRKFYKPNGEAFTISTDTPELIFDRRKTAPAYTPTGNFAPTLAGSGNIDDTVIDFELVLEGTQSVTFPANSLRYENNFTNGEVLSAGTWKFYLVYSGGELAVSVLGPKLTPDVTVPTLSNISATTTGATTADFAIQSNEASTVYWAVFPTATAQQDKATIESGAGSVVFGSQALTLNTLRTINITGLTNSTAYKVHYFVRDGASNETAAAITAEFTTAASDTTAPSFAATFPSSANITQTSFDVQVQLNEPGTAYFVVIADGAAAPSSVEVKAGTASGGGAVLASGTIAVAVASTTYSGSASGLTLGTAYDVYVVAEDDEPTPNIQASPTLLNVTTAASIIVMQDAFAGTTIDTGKWTETDPSDGVTITQNEQLIFTITAGVASTLTNNLQSVATISQGALAADIAYTFNRSTRSTALITLKDSGGADSSAQILQNSTDGVIRLSIRVSGSEVYSLITGFTFAGKVKITIDASDNIRFWKWNVSTLVWDQMGTTQTYNIGTNLLAFIGSNGAGTSGTDTFTVDNLYLTSQDYSTITP